MTERSYGRTLARIAMGIATGIALGGAGAAAAEPPPEKACTWFPDLRCGRHGRYPGFVPPMIHPYLFEDPFITTGLSGWYLWHGFPDDSVMEGGYLSDVALQARLAITDRLALIATKDGAVWFRPGNPAIPDDFGGTDLSLGFKFALIDEPEIPFILTPSLVYEINLGSRGIFQGNGDGVFIPALSAAWSPARWGVDRLHVIADVGGRVPRDTDRNSTAFFYNFHVDYAVLDKLVPFFEIGGFHYTDSGAGTLPVELTSGAAAALGVSSVPIGAFPGFEGNDYANLGNLDVEGDVVSWSAGISFPLNEHLILAAAYEYPMTTRKDLLQQRASVNLTFEF